MRERNLTESLQVVPCAAAFDAENSAQTLS
jgi:hypothetical protein